MADLDLSKISEEQVEVVDKDTAVRYKVVKETINLEALRKEKEELLEELNMKEPTKEELISLGKMYHPYFHRNVDVIQKRIEEIDKVLEQ